MIVQNMEAIEEKGIQRNDEMTFYLYHSELFSVIVGQTWN